jgi:hypothetical protein
VSRNVERKALPRGRLRARRVDLGPTGTIVRRNVDSTGVVPRLQLLPASKRQGQRAHPGDVQRRSCHALVAIVLVSLTDVRAGQAFVGTARGRVVAGVVITAGDGRSDLPLALQGPTLGVKARKSLGEQERDIRDRNVVDAPAPVCVVVAVANKTEAHAELRASVTAEIEREALPLIRLSARGVDLGPRRSTVRTDIQVPIVITVVEPLPTPKGQHQSARAGCVDDRAGHGSVMTLRVLPTDSGSCQLFIAGRSGIHGRVVEPSLGSINLPVASKRPPLRVPCRKCVLEHEPGGSGSSLRTACRHHVTHRLDTGITTGNQGSPRGTLGMGAGSRFGLEAVLIMLTVIVGFAGFDNPPVGPTRRPVSVARRSCLPGGPLRLAL